MMGKNHIKTGSAILTATISITAATASNNLFSYCILDFIFPEELSFSFSNGILNNSFLYVPLGLYLFYIGSLLPDIDNPDSLISSKIVVFKRFSSFLGHRTWTHSVFMMFFCFLLFLINKVFVFLFLGVCIHIFLDSLSAAGVCFLYPFEKYNYYPNGAFFKPGHAIKLYRTGSSEEYFQKIVIVLSVLIVVFSFFIDSPISVLYFWLFY